jgi:hypothetical protein
MRYKKGKMMYMVNRELTAREKQIYDIIPDTDNMTFRNIVDIVRRETCNSIYDARKELIYMCNQ